MADGTKSTD
jgi:hypothetical protein